MHIKTISFFLLVVFSTHISAQKNAVFSDASSSSIVIDGVSSEWHDPFRYYDGTSKLQFSFQNDSANLYFCIKTSDERAEIKMMNAGLEFAIQTGKKSSATLNFPMQKERSGGERPTGIESGNRANIKALKRKMASEIKLMRLKGFTGITDGIYNLEMKEGITVALDWDSFDILTAEYKIPLALLFANTDTVNPLTSSITLKGMVIGGGGQRPSGGPAGGNMDPSSIGSMRMRGDMGGSMGDDMDGGMGGGPPGGGGENGPPPGYMNGSTDTGQDNIIKMKLKLAAW